MDIISLLAGGNCRKFLKRLNKKTDGFIYKNDKGLKSYSSMMKLLAKKEKIEISSEQLSQVEHFLMQSDEILTGSSKKSKSI